MSQQQHTEYAAPHQHLSALDRFWKHSNLERCWKNLESLNQPLDQKLIDFDEENKNSNEKYDATTMTERNSMLLFRDRSNFESHESRTSDGQQLVRELLSEVVHLRASAVPSNLTRDLEAKTENQKTQIQSLKRDLLNS